MDRSTSYFFYYPEKSYELTGQINNVCFLEGLTYFKGRWLPNYGMTDSQIAVTSSEL